MTESRSLDSTGLWGWLSSGLGYHMDNLGVWLLERFPAFGAAYASLLKPRRPIAAPRPGWKFGEEYYDQRRWFACRRGSLWEAAAEHKLAVSLTIPWHNDALVDVTLGNDNSLCLYVCGSFEPNEFALLDHILQPGMVFIDVGANDGYFTLFAAGRVGSAGRVVAVEPSARERANLQHNIERNRFNNVTVVPVALGAVPGHADLRLAHGVHSGHNTLGKFAHDDVQVESLVRVEVDTLDSVTAKLGLDHVDFIKIDVEGAEASVIEGAPVVLRTMRPTLLLEINETALQAQQRSGQGLLSTLRDQFDYEILVFSSSTGLLEALVNDQPLSPNIVARPRELGSRLIGRPRRSIHGQQ